MDRPIHNTTVRHETEARSYREIQVRRATLRDVPAVARLFDEYRQFYEQPADLPRAERFIAERLRLADSVIFTAASSTSDADSSLGFVQLYASLSSVDTARILILNDLFVAMPARKCGVAMALMEAARQYAGSIRACRIELVTGTENAPAQRLYRKLGYEPNRELEAFVLGLRLW